MDGGLVRRMLGTTTIGKTVNEHPELRAMPHVMPEDGVLQSVSMFHDGGSGRMILAVYDGSSGGPTELLSRTASTAVASDRGWQQLPLREPVAASGGSVVWLAWLYEDNPGIYASAGSPGRYSTSEDWTTLGGSLPAMFPAGSQDGWVYSIYATYTTSSSGTGGSDGGTGADACTPSCDGKDCGSDGCGGSCGTCSSGETCSVSGLCTSSTSANLLFHSGFEPGSGPVDTVLNDITGTDRSVAPPNNWDSFSGFSMAYVCGSDDERWAKIVDDPTGSDNRVLHFWLNETRKCGADSRVQARLADGRPTERFQRVRMYLHPDMLELIGSGLPGHWFMLHEIWIRPNWTGEPNSFRIDISARRGDVDGTEKFYWGVDANECCPGGSSRYFWEVDNTSVPVPIGEWFTAETYYKMGDDSSGRIIFTIQRDGGPKQVVADVTDWTYHPDEDPEGIRVWQPLKLYVKPNNVDYVRENGGTLQVYWDDWEIWDGMP